MNYNAGILALENPRNTTPLRRSIRLGGYQADGRCLWLIHGEVEDTYTLYTTTVRGPHGMTLEGCHHKCLSHERDEIAGKMREVLGLI